MKEVSERQLEIIESAGKILTVSGVSGLTIKNLAKEMSFSESAIYRHFKSKEEIIVAMLDYIAYSLEERYHRIETSKLSPEEKLIVNFEIQFTFFKEKPHFVAAVFTEGFMEENHRINQTILKIMSQKVTHLLPIFKEGQENNSFTNEISTEELMHIVMGAVRLQMFKWRVAKFEFDIVKNGNKIIQSLLLLIKHK